MTPHNPPDIGWREILPDPFVTLVLGARGEGKTALSHLLLEEFGRPADRDAYIMGFPSDKEHLLPDWVDILPPTTDRHNWPEDSVVLIHEAHHLLHARESMQGESVEIDKLITISRHRNSSVIFETQQSHRLDKNQVAAPDAILVRWPALMQEQFERRQVRPIIEDARESLEQFVTVHDDADYTYVERDTDDNGVDKLKKHVFVHAEQFRGRYPHELPLADHWCEEISKAYSDPADGGSDRENPMRQGHTSLAEARESVREN